MDEGRVLTCVCMLGYWMWDAVPIWFLYASVLDAGCCADLFFWGYGRLLYWLWIVLRPFSVCFGVGCGMLCRSGSCMLRCWTWNAVPIFSYMLCFLALGRMYIRFYSLFSAVEFSAGGCGSGMGCCGRGVILLRLRGSALLRQGLLSEPEASSAPVSMFLADFRSLSSIRRRSPARTAATSPAYGSFHPPHKEKDGHPQKRDSRPFLTHHT